MVHSRQSSTAKRSSPSPSSSSAPPPKRPKAEAPASAPGRTEEDSAAAAAARSTGSAEDAAAKKDQVGDKPAVALADSSRRRKEQQQQQAAIWGKPVSQRSQLLRLTKREERLKEEICAEFRGWLKEKIRAEFRGRLQEVIRAEVRGQIASFHEKLNQTFNQSQAVPVILGASPPQCRSSCASTSLSELSDVQSPVDNIQIMSVLGERRGGASVGEAGEGVVPEGDPRELPRRQGHMPTHGGVPRAAHGAEEGAVRGEWEAGEDAVEELRP